jgi:arabinofuranosyltransferase
MSPSLDAGPSPAARNVRGDLGTLAARWRALDRSTLLAAAAVALLLAAIVHASWLCEDAFITLRTVDNWVNGHGLRWNVSERVQSYTHPLWMLCVALVYALTRDATSALLVPSLLATATCLILFLRRASDRRSAAAVVLLLTATKAFVEFSSPGLENPLVHLLLVVYCVCAARALATGARLGPVVLSTALLLLTRLDLLWLLLPSLVGTAWAARAELARWRTWLWAAPLVAWEAFSLVYYGFPLPNTAYAKLETGVPVDETLAQGLRYLKACWLYDPVSAVLIVTALLVGFASRRRWLLLLALGIVAWLAYLVRVGGDFMLGRLLTPALLVAGVVIADGLPARALRFAPWLAAGVLLASLALPRSPLWGAPRTHERRWLPENLTDERSMAYPSNGLFYPREPGGPRAHPWVQEVLAAVAAGVRVKPYRSVGIVGYYAGPSLHIIDEFGLCDPLLARLPAEPAWSPGHFSRRVPAGYLETLRDGRNQLADRELARRYDELATIVRGPLFTSERWRAILSWNLRGRRAYARDYEVRVMPASTAAELPGGGAATSSAGVLRTAPRGLRLTFTEPITITGATVTVGSDDRYTVTFQRGNTSLWTTTLSDGSNARGRLTSHHVSAASPLEIDSLLIRGRGGDYAYDVGQVVVDAAR